MDVEELRRQINQSIDQFAAQSPKITFSAPEEAEKPKRTDGKRAVRTKDTGDNVYLIDDNAKTKAWITKPEILEALGFAMTDVEEIEQSSLIGYQMQPSIYKVDE